MNKQAYLNEVMKELKILNVENRYDLIRAYLSEIDDAFESERLDSVYDKLGTPSHFAKKIKEQQKPNKKTFEYVDENTYPETSDVQVDEQVQDEENESEENESEKNESEDNNKNQTTSNKQQQNQYEDALISRLDRNRLFTIVLVIALVLFLSNPATWLIGISIFGIFGILFVSLAKVVLVILAIVLIVKLLKASK